MGAHSTFVQQQLTKLGSVAGVRTKYRDNVKKFGENWANGWLADAVTSIEACQRLIDDPLALFLDTETTDVGPHAEIIEIAYTNTPGYVSTRPDAAGLFLGSESHPTSRDSYLVIPQGPIAASASATHGISQHDIDAHGQRWSVVSPLVRAAITQASAVVIYNKKFEHDLLLQTAFTQGVDAIDLSRYNVIDPSNLFGCICGDWLPYFNDYRSPKLEGGHRALSDCDALIIAVARAADLLPVYQEFQRSL